MRTTATIAALAATIAGCGGGSSSKPQMDASLIYLDSGPADAAVDAPDPVLPDARVVVAIDGGMDLIGTCAAPVDLDTLGTTSGGITKISGNNGAAMAAAATDVVGPTCAMDLDGNHARYPVEFSYTMQSTAHLRASTAVDGTAPSFDTVVWIVDQCGTAGMELGCNDELSRTEGRSRAFSRGLITQGTSVRIIVAGYTPPSSGRTNRAPFTLEVGEVPDNPAGGSCSAQSPFCVSGYTCVTLGQPTGTCNADGSLNGACRVTGTPCDGTMRCSVDTPVTGNTGICQEPSPVGTVCTPATQVCVAGAHCTDDPTGTGETCRMDGSEDGQCLLTMPYCASTLRCSRDTPSANRPGTCEVPLALGALCQPQTSACVTGAHCVRDSATATTSHCVQDGTRGGRCLPGNSCDPGLTCNGFSCQ